MTGPDDSRMQDALRRAFLEDMGLGRDGAPATIGPYRVVEELGEGGGGRVFLAIHQDLLKRVALKVLDAGPGTPRARVERFRREATAAARLRHPNIVGVHDIGQDGSAHYIAMDLVEGGTLLDWIERKRPSLEERLRVVESVARAVACAHEAGVLHRDLKPLNILMRPEGDPVVVDFGLARQEDDESLTHEGAVMGTPAYMAPEQLRGALGELDARTDVYALGVILYQTVAGTVPYQGESSTALHGQIQRRQARAPSSVRSDVPRAVDVICARCLDPDPALRYATARALADDIRRLRSGEPLVARPISRLALIARGLARRKGTAALLAAASGLLLWAAWAGLSQRGRFDQISYAHRVQSAYGALAPRVDPVLARAEESRDAATVEEKTAILADLERRLAGGADDTGVGEAYRAWTMFLLDVEGATAALEEARRRHPENPFIPLVAARMHLRRYAESVSWPAASGVALYATAEPFQSLSPIETPEMRENLERAHAAVLAAIQSSVWHELPALGWIIDLLDGVERFAAGDMRGAVAKLPRPGDRADLEIDGALLLALAYCRLGDLDAAAHAAAELARNRPRLLPAALILSECHAHRGYRRMAQHQDALGDFLEARAALSRLQHRPELQQTIADLEVSIASARQQRGEDPRPELQSALAAYDRLLAARPGNYRLRFNRGMALVSLADAGGAPRDPGARPEADARAALMDEALAEVERAYAESAEDELIGSGLAQAHVGRLLAERAAGVLEDEAFDPAFRALDQVERHGREKADLHYARASLHLVRADNARARRRAAAADLERAAELAARAAAMSPLFLEARQLASTATLLLALEKPVPAEEILAAAAVSREHRLGGVPNAPAPAVLAAWLDRLAAVPDRAGAASLAAAALGAWQDAAREAPQEPAAWASLALACAALADLGGDAELHARECCALGVQAANEAITLAADRAAGHAARARVAAAGGDTEAALAGIRRARGLPDPGGFRGRVAAALNASAWLVVREEHPGEGRHAAALQLIELALEAAPERGELLNTLGVALYRNGDLARALEVLQASDRANRRSFAAGHPADAVFLALCHLGRGDAAQARAAGERARRLLAAEPFASDPECRAFLAEMERRFAALDPD